MASETLAVPEEHLPEVVRVIRAGLNNTPTSPKVNHSLGKWCDEMEEYLNETGVQDE